MNHLALPPNTKKRVVKKPGTKWIAIPGTNPNRYPRYSREYVDADYKTKLTHKPNRYYVNGFYSEYEGGMFRKDGQDLMYDNEDMRKEIWRRLKRRSRDLFYYVRGTGSEVSLQRIKFNHEGRQETVEEIDPTTLSIEDLLIAKIDLNDEDLLWKLSSYQGSVPWYIHDFDCVANIKHKDYVPPEFRLTTEQIAKLLAYLLDD